MKKRFCLLCMMLIGVLVLSTGCGNRNGAEDEDKDMIPFDIVVKDMLNDMGLGCKVCSTTEEAKAAMEEWGMGNGEWGMERRETGPRSPFPIPHSPSSVQL